MLLGIGVFLSITILVVGLWPVRLLPQSSCPVHVHWEAFKQLKRGMSNDEVEAILGGPEGDYRTRNDIYYVFSAPGAHAKDNNGDIYRPPGSIKREWLSDEYAIELWYGPDGTVNEARGGGAERIPSWLEQLLDSFLQRFR
jgi:hypothetical protein